MSGQTATRIMNNKYNKGTYTLIAGAVLTVVFVGLKDYGIEVSTEFQGAITTLIMSIVTLVVPNKENI